MYTTCRNQLMRKVSCEHVYSSVGVYPHVLCRELEKQPDARPFLAAICGVEGMIICLGPSVKVHVC